MILSAASIAASSMHSLGAPPPTKTEEEEEADAAKAASIMQGLKSLGAEFCGKVDEERVKKDFFLPDKTFPQAPPPTWAMDRAGRRRAQREHDRVMKQINKKRRHR